ncbi:MAG TPA: cation diffusion facilitator family transporter [Acidobacteriota bacterium]|nr:cation diffusion facilitator family transporter [Acidobacteriota bacterium]
MNADSPRLKLARYAWLSIGAALATIGLKTSAYLLTGSVGLLSDAIESLVNFSAALLALYVIRVGARPPDEQHAYGHEKAEYFSSGAEGGMIVIAAVTIVWVCIRRLIEPQEIDQVDLGIGVSFLATMINLVVARVILAAGRRYRSIALEADAHHLMTDVWTSGGVIAGVGLVGLTGWNVLDPILGLGIAFHVAWVGVGLLRRSILGLMDTALPSEDIAKIQAILDANSSEKVQYHALRTRQSGARSFVSLHIQVPGNWSVQRGHDLAEKMEAEIRQALPLVTVFTHIEPREDPRSFADLHLERRERKESH